MAKKTKKNQKKEELIKTSQYDIFNIIEDYNEGTNIYITLGKYMIDNNFDSVESAKCYIDSKPYKLIGAVAGIFAQHTIEQIELQKNIKKGDKNEK